MMGFLEKPLGSAIVIIGLIALIPLGVWGAAACLKSIINDRVAAAVAERDSHWTSEIAKSEAIAAQNIIEQMRASHAADLVATAEIARLKAENVELEKRNAELPDSDGSGIDIERTRLLNNRPLTNHPN